MTALTNAGFRFHFLDLLAPARADRKVTAAGARKRLVRRIIACSILFACIAIASAAIMLTNSRARMLADAERELRNTALVLAEQSARSFEALTLVETGLIQRIEKLGVTSTAELRDRLSGYDAHVMLRDTINGLPHVESVSVFDPTGDIVNFSRQWPVPRFNITDRDYFKTFIADRRMGTILSEPVLNRTTGTWSIYLGRKFFASNGEAIGIINGAIERRYLERFFHKINLGAGSTIALYRRDGVLLASDPPQGADRRAPVQTDKLDAVLARPQQDVVRLTDIDGNEQLVAVQDVASYPLKVAVTTTTDAALADWTREAIFLMAAAGLICLVIAAATFVVVRQLHDYSELARDRADADVNGKATELVLRETERVHKLLNKQKLQLDTILDNMVQGVVMLDAEATLVVCNNRYLEIYGLSPDVIKPGTTLQQLIQHRLDIGILKGDVDQTVQRIMASLAEGKSSTTTAKLSGGRVIAIFTQPMAEGGWVVTHQDVTEQHRIERDADRAQRFLLTVIENVPSIVIVKDARDLKYVLVNGAAEKFYGVSRSEIIGRTASDLFPKASAGAIAAQDKTLLKSGSELSVGTQMIETPANGFRHVMVRRLAIQDGSGTPQFLLSVIDDMTK
jgi:PAS domain S-box-containing protein